MDDKLITTPYIDYLRSWANERVQRDLLERGKPVVVAKPKLMGTFNSSSSKAIYKVFDRKGKLTCNCPGYVFRYNCKHIRSLI